MAAAFRSMGNLHFFTTIMRNKLLKHRGVNAIFMLRNYASKFVPLAFHETYNLKEHNDIPTSRERSVFLRSLVNNDVINAILYKNILYERKEVAAYEISDLMELLLRKNELVHAEQCFQQLSEMHDIPEQRTFSRYLRELASAGEYERITHIGNTLSECTKKDISYNTFECIAHAEANKGEAYLRQLSDKLRAARTPENLESLHKQFPRGGILRMLHEHTELYTQVLALAEEFISKGKIGPINIVWQYHVINGNEKAAKDIWDKYLHEAGNVFTFYITKTAQIRKDEKIIRIAIAQMRDNLNIKADALGILYSHLIEIQMDKNNLCEALQSLEAALKDVKLGNLSAAVIDALKMKVQAAWGKFSYENN